MAYEGTNGTDVEREARRRAEPLDIETLRRRVRDLQGEIADADRRLRVLTRERPLLAVGLAVAAGFLLGRALRRV